AILLDQLHAASRVSRAIVPVHIIRRARDYLPRAVSVVVAVISVTIVITVAVPVVVSIVVPISIPASSAIHREVSPAAVVHPNAAVVRSPAVALRASRLATLSHQLRSPWSVG